jgi:hypothetical protein
MARQWVFCQDKVLYGDIPAGSLWAFHPRATSATNIYLKLFDRAGGPVDVILSTFESCTGENTDQRVHLVACIDFDAYVGKNYRDRLVECIKLVRDETGWGLKQAKEAVEALFVSLGEGA